MGVVDDYYGGYESLSLFTDEYGNVDFEAAYEAQLPDEDGDYDYTMDPFERAINYKFKQAMREFTVPGWVDTGRKTNNGKPIYEGSCSRCHAHTTVPFVPLTDGPAPMCKRCWEQSKSAKRGRGGRGRAQRAAAPRRDGSSSTVGAGSSRAAEQNAG